MLAALELAREYGWPVIRCALLLSVSFDIPTEAQRLRSIALRSSSASNLRTLIATKELLPPQTVYMLVSSLHMTHGIQRAVASVSGTLVLKILTTSVLLRITILLPHA